MSIKQPADAAYDCHMSTSRANTKISTYLVHGFCIDVATFGLRERLNFMHVQPLIMQKPPLSIPSMGANEGSASTKQVGKRACILNPTSLIERLRSGRFLHLRSSRRQHLQREVTVNEIPHIASDTRDLVCLYTENKPFEECCRERSLSGSAQLLFRWTGVTQACYPTKLHRRPWLHGIWHRRNIQRCAASHHRGDRARDDVHPQHR